jgi:hypothetical protein
MRRIGLWFACALLASGLAAHAQETPVLGLGTDSPALLRAAGETPIRAEVMKEIEALRARLTQLWNVPAITQDPRELTVDIDMKLKPDGTLDGPPEVLTGGDSAWFKAARDSALRAIDRGQPFIMLKPEHYDQWKEIIVTFDPHFVPRK